MNTLKAKLLTVAATLAVAAATASAGTTLNASVPFPFTAGISEVMPAGDYMIRNEGNVWYLVSNETRHTGLAVQRAGLQPGAREKAQLVFHCRANNCSLSAIHAGAQWGATFSDPKPRKSDVEELGRVIVVDVTVSNSD